MNIQDPLDVYLVYYSVNIKNRKYFKEAYMPYK